MAKKEKKSPENLEESKKSVTFAPEMSKMTSVTRFVTPLNYVLVPEHVDSTPDDALKHNEALSIREILVRSSRGQRLNVNTRMRSEGVPDNMYTEEELKKIGHESINDAPPDDINDIVDVYAYQEELEQRKKELQQRRAEKHKGVRSGSPTDKPEGKKSDVKPSEGSGGERKEPAEAPEG